MDAMGLSNKKPHTVSTSHSGSFTHNPPDIPKTPGIVSIPCTLYKEYLSFSVSGEGSFGERF